LISCRAGADPAGAPWGAWQSWRAPQSDGGEVVNMFGGIEVAGHEFGLGHTRFAIEAGTPVYQNLNGPQMGQDWQLNAVAAVRFWYRNPCTTQRALPLTPSAFACECGNSELQARQGEFAEGQGVMPYDYVSHFCDSGC